MKSRLNKSINRKRDRVLRMLKEAFADVPCPYEDCDREYHEYFRDMSEHLWDTGVDEMPWELPRILGDLINSDDRELIDDMVWHLRVDRERDHRGPKECCWEDSKTQEYYRQSGSYLGAVLKRSYDNITRQQSGAVAEWLRSVRRFPELYPPEVNSALRYWKRRAAYRHR